MAVETTTTINGMNAAWPLGSDKKNEGDNHLRLIKTLLKARFDDSGTNLVLDKPAQAPGMVSTADVTLPSINGGPLGGLHNLIINGSFRVNERAFAGGAIAAGGFGYDRWKADTGGATMTVAAGVATITAGAIVHVVEGINIEVTGTHTLSWTGTATAQVNGGAVTNGGQVSLTAGSNATVRFTGGTVGNVQLEFGAKATPFERRPYPLEKLLCERYCERTPRYNEQCYMAANGGIITWKPFRVPKRTNSPTMSPVFTNAINAATFVVASSQLGFGVQVTKDTNSGAANYTFEYIASDEL